MTCPGRSKMPSRERFWPYGDKILTRILFRSVNLIASHVSFRLRRNKMCAAKRWVQNMGMDHLGKTSTTIHECCIPWYYWTTRMGYLPVQMLVNLELRVVRCSRFAGSLAPQGSLMFVRLLPMSAILPQIPLFRRKPKLLYSRT